MEDIFKWQVLKKAARKLHLKTYNVTQTSTRRLVQRVAKMVTLVDLPQTLNLHVLQVLRVDAFHADAKLKLNF